MFLLTKSESFYFNNVNVKYSIDINLYFNKR